MHAVDSNHPECIDQEYKISLKAGTDSVQLTGFEEINF